MIQSFHEGGLARPGTKIRIVQGIVEERDRRTNSYNEIAFDEEFMTGR